MPPIHALTVSVGYGDYLGWSLPIYARTCASVTVVSTYEDVRTRRICEAVERLFHHNRFPCDIRLLCTDAFTLNGASFNKGLAMEEGRQRMPWQDWALFFDCDVVPPAHWVEEAGPLQMGYLYGCWRRATSLPSDIGRLDLPRMDDDRVGYGYFQLFHTKDPKVQRTPLLDTHWRHAGNYDSNFLLSFRDMVQELPFEVWHLGDGHHQNWFGAGRRQEFEAMMKVRGDGGIHPSEALDPL